MGEGWGKGGTNHAVRQRGNQLTALHPLQEHVIRRPAEIDQREPRGACLRARWRVDPVHVRPEEPVGELHHGVAEVYDCVVALGWDPGPVLPRVVDAGLHDPQSREPVEEHGYGAEVRVFAYLYGTR